jgi:hypothetical protein
MPAGDDLKNLQALLYRLITAPGGVAEGLAAERESRPGALGELDDVIVGDERLGAVERLEIYANAYFYRILDCLKEDFPATLAVVGADNFHNLITGYLVEHPPTEPSIFYAGRYLADFLATHPMRARWPYAAQLARLERTLVEIFHAADAPALSAEAIRAIAPAQWPALALRRHPASAILDCQWRVDELRRDIDEGRRLNEPAHAPASVLVWRRNGLVHYRALEAGERAALTLAAEGASFAAMCEAVAAAAEGDDAVGLINRLLGRWLADGLFSAA